MRKTRQETVERSRNLSARLETVRYLNEINSSYGVRRKYTTNIQHIADALVAAGYTSLDEQAKALGIHRATVWTIVRDKHKLGRLNTNTTNRMLANPELPPCIRDVIQRYLAERPVLGQRAKRRTTQAVENAAEHK